VFSFIFPKSAYRQCAQAGLFRPETGTDHGRAARHDFAANAPNFPHNAA